MMAFEYAACLHIQKIDPKFTSLVDLGLGEAYLVAGLQHVVILGSQPRHHNQRNYFGSAVSSAVLEFERCVVDDALCIRRKT